MFTYILCLLFSKNISYHIGMRTHCMNPNFCHCFNQYFCGAPLCTFTAILVVVVSEEAGRKMGRINTYSLWCPLFCLFAPSRFWIIGKKVQQCHCLAIIVVLDVEEASSYPPTRNVDEKGEERCHGVAGETNTCITVL